MTTVTLTGHINVPPSQMDLIRTALETHISLTRAEPGCISFDVTDRADIPGRFDVAEEFTDPQAFTAHQARVKASDWGRISAGIPRDYVIKGMPETS